MRGVTAEEEARLRTVRMVEGIRLARQQAEAAESAGLIQVGRLIYALQSQGVRMDFTQVVRALRSTYAIELYRAVKLARRALNGEYEPWAGPTDPEVE